MLRPRGANAAPQKARRRAPPGRASAYSARLFLADPGMLSPVAVRDARIDEYPALGQLMVEVYGQLPGFLSPQEQPAYYAMLADMGAFARLKRTRLLVAELDGAIQGGVVYFGDMSQYAPMTRRLTDACGMRLLAVRDAARGLGLGRQLMETCIRQGSDDGHARMVLHTAEVMHTARAMYQRRGFQPMPSLDFTNGHLQVFGLSLALRDA